MTAELCPGCNGTGLQAGSPFEGDRTPWDEHLAAVVDSYRGLPPEASWTFLGREPALPCERCGGVRAVEPPELFVREYRDWPDLATAVHGTEADKVTFRELALRPAGGYATPPLEYSAPPFESLPAAREGRRGERPGGRRLAAACAAGQGALFEPVGGLP